MADFKKIEKHKVSDTVFEQLRHRLIQNQYPYGSKLPSEQALASQFGVSRTSVRAALQKLVMLGLLETKNGEGTFVKKPTAGKLIDPIFKSIQLRSEQIVEILEFRLAIEMLSCRLAAERATLQQINDLESIVNRMLTAIEQNDSEQYTLEDMRFHICVAQMAHNSLVLTVIENLSDFYLEHLREMNQHIHLTFGIDFHIAILEAIKNKDGQTSEKHIKESILHSMEEVQKWMKDQQSEVADQKKRRHNTW